LQYLNSRKAAKKKKKGVSGTAATVVAFGGCLYQETAPGAPGRRLPPKIPRSETLPDRLGRRRCENRRRVETARFPETGYPDVRLARLETRRRSERKTPPAGAPSKSRRQGSRGSPGGAEVSGGQHYEQKNVSMAGVESMEFAGLRLLCSSMPRRDGASHSQNTRGRASRSPRQYVMAKTPRMH